MMEWVPVVEEGLKAGNLVFDEDKRSKFIAFINYLFIKKKKILLFGNSGTGKSQFIEELRGNVTTAIRTHATQKFKIPVANLPTVFIDVPGQAGYTYQRREQVDFIIQDGVEGIINIVDYGYHEIETPNISQPIFIENKVNKHILEVNRNLELEQLAEWLPRISPNKNIKWIINLITKADVWWDDRIEVQNYYHSLEYGEKFRPFTNFMSVVNLPFCSIIKPYYKEFSSPRFGEIEKKALKSLFFTTLTGLIQTK